jgi:DNA polymerase-3 subunit alpha/error-prone DNA polymerase
VAARGSVVSSQVGHLLGFSPVDPLKEGLLFERFLHAARTKPPDVDLDVPSERREELIAWTLRHLGTHRAALISTHVMFRRRSAWRAGLNALGVEAPVIDLLFASMPNDPEWDEPPRVTGPLAEHAPAIEALIGRFHRTSIHPGGVALAAEHLEDVTPLDAPRVTQLDAQALEALGVLKLDLLGSRALSVIDETIRRAGGVEPSPERDAATLEALRNADTLGCAQVESPPVRATLLSLPLQSKEELTSALALVRPGPSAGRARARFLSRMSEGRAEDEPIYDEDLIKLISATTRLPLDEADELRARVIRGEPTNFLELARAAGTPPRQLQRAWRVVQQFSAYSFSKAHAASTAAQAWTAVQLKHRHPAAFACAALNHYGGAYPLRTLVADFQRHGVDFLKPSINASLPSSSLEGDAVRLGFSLVKHLSTATLKRILAKRPFSTFEDFLTVRPARAELEALVMSGACDDLAPLRPELFPLAHHDVLSLLADSRPLSELVPRRAEGASGARWRALQRIKHELLFLDVHVTAHPLGVLRDEAARIGCVPIAELARRNGWRARFAGLIAASRRHRTERGKLMQFVTFEDETGLVESRLRLEALHDALSSPGPWLLDGLVQVQQRAVTVELTEARPFHQRPR